MSQILLSQNKTFHYIIQHRISGYGFLQKPPPKLLHNFRYAGTLTCIYKLQKNMDYSERLINSTIRIEAILPDETATGTGFFFHFDLTDGDKKLPIPVVVTNKHVVEGAVALKFFCKEKSDQGTPAYGKTFEIILDSKIYGLIIEHPETNIDLVIIPLNFLSNSAYQLGKTIYYDVFGETTIPSPTVIEELLAIEEIHMVGYPNGLWDQTNNLPIVRKGITATNPIIDYEGEKKFLIDIAAFPGSSGSPVFLYNPGPYQSKSSIKLGGRIYLLGILYRGPMFEVEGEIITTANPNKNNLQTISQIPMNLGAVIKSEKLNGFRTLLIKINNDLTI